MPGPWPETANERTSSIPEPRLDYRWNLEPPSRSAGNLGYGLFKLFCWRGRVGPIFRYLLDVTVKISLRTWRPKFATVHPCHGGRSFAYIIGGGGGGGGGRGSSDRKY